MTQPYTCLDVFLSETAVCLEDLGRVALFVYNRLQVEMIEAGLTAAQDRQPVKAFGSTSASLKVFQNGWRDLTCVYGMAE